MLEGVWSGGHVYSPLVVLPQDLDLLGGHNPVDYKDNALTHSVLLITLSFPLGAILPKAIQRECYTSFAQCCQIPDPQVLETIHLPLPSRLEEGGGCYYGGRTLDIYNQGPIRQIQQIQGHLVRLDVLFPRDSHRLGTVPV